MSGFISAEKARELASDVDTLATDLQWMMRSVKEAVEEAVAAKRFRAEVKLDYNISEDSLYRVKQDLKKLGYSIVVKRQRGVLGSNLFKPSFVIVALSW